MHACAILTQQDMTYNRILSHLVLTLNYKTFFRQYSYHPYDSILLSFSWILKKEYEAYYLWSHRRTGGKKLEVWPKICFVKFGGGGGRVTEIFKTYINTFWKRTMHIYSYFHQFNAQLPFPLIILSKVGPTFTYKLSDTSLYRSWGKRINTFK
jgi:hypothetical protein